MLHHTVLPAKQVTVCVQSTPEHHVHLLYVVWVQGQRVINPYESRWFWIVLIANPIIWALSCLSALLGLDWGECCTHLQLLERGVGAVSTRQPATWHINHMQTYHQLWLAQPAEAT